MERLKNIIFIKSKLIKKPVNIFSIDKSVEKYENVLELWKKFKKDRKNMTYKIYCIFMIHLQEDNHIIMYHSKFKNNSLIMCKINNKYYNYILPYIEINNKLSILKNTNFIAYYN